MNKDKDRLVEYGLISAVITILAVLALTFLGGRLEILFERFSNPDDALIEPDTTFLSIHLDNCSAFIS